MSKSKKREAVQTEAASQQGRRLPWSTIISAIVCVPLLFVSACAGRRWFQLSRQESRLEGELETLTARNAVLQPAFEVMQNQKFQVCNKSTDTLTIPWLAAVYSDGQHLQLFDALRCQGWHAQTIEPGSSRVFNFSSPQEGCNWSGAVTFYAFRLVRESDQGVSAYDVSGPWRGFDRDCFTVE